MAYSYHLDVVVALEPSLTLGAPEVGFDFVLLELVLCWRSRTALAAPVIPVVVQVHVGICIRASSERHWTSTTLELKRRLEVAEGGLVLTEGTR